MSMLNGVNFTRTGDPVADLKTYATARGISETEAKKELEAEFGVAKAVSSSTDEDVSISTSSEDLSLDDSTDETDSSSEFSKTDAGRKELQETIEYWNAKLKEATDAKDSYGVAYAQKQCKKYQEMAYNWDTNRSTETDSSDSTDSTDSSDSTSSSSSTSSASSSDSSSSKAIDRKRIQGEIEKWSAKLKEATDAKDEWGVKQAQSILKGLQTKAYEWDQSNS